MKLILAIMALVAVTTISGCVTNEMAIGANKVICEDVNGGLWLDEFSECCPKGCPDIPIDFPITAQEQAISERCSVCWLS